MHKTEFLKTDSQMPPLRSLNDFLFESARFQIPNIKDLDKWGNRVVSNLLYYQTNYFFMYVVIFFIIGFMHPGKMGVGLIVMLVVLAIYTYLLSEGRIMHNLKKENPLAGGIIVILGSCFIMYYLSSLLVFLFGMLMPFSAIFVHSSLRLRNVQNKLTNKIQRLGLQRTPMGVLLGHLGMEPDIFD